MAKLSSLGSVATILFTLSVTILPQGPLDPAMARSRTLIHRPPGTIHVDASMVLVPVHVTTPDGAPITDLTASSFRLFEESVEQKIAYFAKDDAPVSIGVLLDTSASMRKKIRWSAQAAAKFFETANPQDEFFLVEFNERPKLTVPFTTDTDQIYRRVLHAGPFGRTSLLDAVQLACQYIKDARNTRKALLIISDGGDNHSRMTPRAVRNAVVEADLQTYAIGIFDDGSGRKLAREELEGPNLLQELAEETGGRHYRVDSLDELPSVASRVSIDLRNEYLLGYFSTNADRDGKYRRLKLDVDVPNITKPRIFHRSGYYAPAE